MNTTTRLTTLRQQIARRALATIRTPHDAQILDVVRTGPVITVATHQDGDRLPYCVDSFRLLTPAEKDPEDWAPHRPHDFTLVDQYGGAGADEVPGMLAKAVAFARAIVE
ncbi:hypothetical protein [Streptomyces sp. NPDC090022]|uniref:hypothetical protein n=1 Tax=Streptomyces sp. NPDC090022 TaxID=3365920 RepID=UPI003802AD94